MGYSVVEPVAIAPHLDQLVLRKSIKEAADLIGVDSRTIRRWLADDTEIPKWVEGAARSFLTFKRHDKNYNFTFIDLFAGIGGTRKGFEAAGGRCVFTSEWDAFARRTYASNFHDDPFEHATAGDITKIDASSIPNHDVLVAGFPCQPFSIAGVSKKQSLGKKHGFLDETQGTLFFDVARIIKHKRPRAFMLENVKNLKSHDKGQTFKVIIKTLEEELGYKVTAKVINAKSWVPQGRERIYIVGYDSSYEFDWNEFKAPTLNPRLSTILHREDFTETPEPPYTDEKGFVNSKYTLTDNLWEYLQAYKAKHSAAGNGFGYGLVGPNDVARTLSARYYKDGSEILIKTSRGSNPRRLTPREAARLMGFSSDFDIPVSDTQAYKQFGNSVVVPVIESVATEIASDLMSRRV